MPQFPFKKVCFLPLGNQCPCSGADNASNKVQAVRLYDTLWGAISLISDLELLMMRTV